MVAILFDYGAFLLKTITVFVAILILILVIVKSKSTKEDASLQIKDLRKKYSKITTQLANFRLSAKQQKAQKKANAKQEKAEQKTAADQSRPCVYVLRFKGDISASAVEALREEVSAVLAVAKPGIDEVLLCLESPGGVVHGYGLAASQLKRLKDKGIGLTAAIDKVAASGGYMMACVADKIVAAPFAIVGSIGVVAQVPNLHRLLKKHAVDVDVMTAGEYKRTVTLLGENTEKGKQKFQQELEQTHDLFKDFVQHNRQQLDMSKVATGEHWFGQQALDLKLVDQLSTSDDLIIASIAEKDVLEVSFAAKPKLLDKLFKRAETSCKTLLSWAANSTNNLH